MSTDSTCHNIGISGECGYLCKVFQAGECTAPPLPEKFYVQVEQDGEFLAPEYRTFSVDRINDSDFVYTRERIDETQTPA